VINVPTLLEAWHLGALEAAAVVVTAAAVVVVISEELVEITKRPLGNTIPATEGVRLIQEVIKRTKLRVTEIKMVQ
jgi:hypothetical protein